MAHRREIQRIGRLNSAFRGLQFRNNGHPMALFIFERPTNGLVSTQLMWRQTVGICMDTLRAVLIRMGFILPTEIEEFNHLTFAQIATCPAPYRDWLRGFFSHLMGVMEIDNLANLLHILTSVDEWQNPWNDDIMIGSDPIDQHEPIDITKNTMITMQIFLPGFMHRQVNEQTFQRFRNQFFSNAEERRQLFVRYAAQGGPQAQLVELQGGPFAIGRGLDEADEATTQMYKSKRRRRREREGEGYSDMEEDISDNDCHGATIGQKILSLQDEIPFGACAGYFYEKDSTKFPPRPSPLKQVDFIRRDDKQPSYSFGAQSIGKCAQGGKEVYLLRPVNSTATRIQPPIPQSIDSLRTPQHIDDIDDESLSPIQGEYNSESSIVPPAVIPSPQSLDLRSIPTNASIILPPISCFSLPSYHSTRDGLQLVPNSIRQTSIAITPINQETSTDQSILNFDIDDNALDNGVAVWTALVEEWPQLEVILRARYGSILEFTRLETVINFNIFYNFFRRNVLQSYESRTEIGSPFSALGPCPRTNSFLSAAQDAATFITD